MEHLTSTRAGKAQKRETNLATMMIVIVSVFTICNLYQGMFWILKYYDLVSDLTILYLDSFSDFLEVFTSSTNVLIYVKFSDKFQKKFLEFFCSCLKERNQVPDIEMTETGKPKKTRKKNRSLRALLMPKENQDENPSSNFYSFTTNQTNQINSVSNTLNLKDVKYSHVNNK